MAAGEGEPTMVSVLQSIETKLDRLISCVCKEAPSVKIQMMKGSPGGLAAVGTSSAAAVNAAEKKRVLSQNQKNKMTQRREAAKVSKAEGRSSGLAAAPIGSVELLPFTHGGFKYLRPGIRFPGGSIQWTSNALWENNRGARGDWVGVFDPLHENINVKAEEPNLNFGGGRRRRQTRKRV